MPVRGSAGNGVGMRFSLLILLATAAGLDAKPFQWPWSSATKEQGTEQKTGQRFSLFPNSRTREQQRLNEVTSPKPTSRAEQVMQLDQTKEFNPSAANFGSGRSVTGKKAATSEFHFVNRTQTKSFNTRGFTTKEASGTDSKFATKSAQTKESWFARLTASGKTYATRENTDSNKGLQGKVLPSSEKKFVARGRRQAELDKNGAAGLPMGGDRDSGQSWSGDVRPLSIQDVKTLLNKN